MERAGELGSTTKTVDDGSETREGIGVRRGRTFDDFFDDFRL